MTPALRIVDRPQPGYYRLRLVRGGPFVGARIAHEPSRDPETGEPLDRSWHWSAWINGDLVAEPGPNPERAGVFKIWPYGLSIAPSEYHYLLADRAWLQRQAGMDPRKPVDVRAIPPILPPGK